MKLEYKIKFIKNTEKMRVGDIVTTNKESAEHAVLTGVAEYVEVPLEQAKYIESNGKIKEDSFLHLECNDCEAVLKVGLYQEIKDLKCNLCGSVNLKLIGAESATKTDEQLEKILQDTKEELMKLQGKDTETLIKQTRVCYDQIMQILHKYSDIPENYYKIVALWIIGTYIHDTFETFPLLFINAIKGSGKSRLMKLIITLSYNGKIVIDLKEAPLFRTANKATLGIDEFETVGGKENATIRTLINAAYKKGAKVERMKKVNEKGQEKQVVESFELYCSIVMANIWGMDEVVADRCLQIILEKSDKPHITKLIEDFSTNPQILKVKKILNELQCSLCSVVTEKNIINSWNDYVLNAMQYNTTLTTHTTYTTGDTQTTPLSKEEISIFSKINDTKIQGRDLELFFPIFIIASVIGDDLFDEILELSHSIIKDKKNEEYTESKDVSLIDYISGKPEFEREWVLVKDIAREFRIFVSAEEDELKWINDRWVGRALKRNKLIMQKRRVGKGIEVLLNVQKAKSKLRFFKEELEKTEVKDAH